jgi:hypothetical protein
MQDLSLLSAIKARNPQSENCDAAKRYRSSPNTGSKLHADRLDYGLQNFMQTYWNYGAFLGWSSQKVLNVALGGTLVSQVPGHLKVHKKT